MIPIILISLYIGGKVKSNKYRTQYFIMLQNVKHIFCDSILIFLEEEAVPICGTHVDYNQCVFRIMREY